LRRQVGYTDEFVERLGQLTYGQQRLVEDSIRNLLSADDPTIFAHHLESRAYFCCWSHRVRANLLIVFRVSKKSITFLSTGTHSQAYRPTGD
jgi:mRNA-degrading endonuclease YafQ of YafQ-DinJ toxin-antitoxin module